MLTWRSSIIDEMVLAAFAEKELLPPKEVARWRVLHVADFVTVCEAFIEMEPHVDSFRRIFSERALSVGKPPRIVSMAGLALAAA